MRVTVRFLDGEELEGQSETSSLQRLGFPITVPGGNNRTVWVSLAAIKYVVLHGTEPARSSSGDPRAGMNLPKVVLHFLDGETFRTYKDDRFGQEGEGFNLRLWDARTRTLTRVVVSLQALKGIFFVDEWDSRSENEKQVNVARRPKSQAAGVPTAWVHEEVATDIDPEIRRLAQGYQRRLALERDISLSGSDPAAFEKAIRVSLDRLLEEDLVALRPAQKNQLVTAILRDAVGYGPLDPLLKDASVTEIMVNAPDEVFIERNGQLMRSQARFEDVPQLMNVIRRIAASIGRRIDESSPMVDARLPDGSRLNAIIPPAALRGPALTIRKFRSFQMGLDDLIAEGTMSPAMASFLQHAVQGRLSILISGGTGSGKTTTMNVLGSLIPGRERVVTIEDAAELQLNHPHVVALEYRPPNVEGRGELTIRALLRNSLRMRPDRVLVGEVRDAAALDMLQAMNTGHDGSMSTIHANSAVDAFSRLETMVLAGSVELPLPAVRAQIASAVNLVIHQGRMPDGTRKIVQISEVRGYEGDHPILVDIFRLHIDPGGGATFAATGALPTGLQKMEFHGVAVPPELFSPEMVYTPPAARPVPVAASPPPADVPASPLEAAARAVASLGALVPGARSEPLGDAVTAEPPAFEPGAPQSPLADLAPTQPPAGEAPPAGAEEGTEPDEITELREIAMSLPPSPGRAEGRQGAPTPEQRLAEDASERTARPSTTLLRASNPERRGGVLHERRAEGEEVRPKAEAKPKRLPKNRREAMRFQIAETLGTDEDS